MIEGKAKIFISIIVMFPDLLLGYQMHNQSSRVASRRMSDMLDTTIDHRNNYCGIYDQIKIGTLSRRNALNGLNVSVGVIDYVLNQQTGKLDQDYIAVKVFDEVARRAKFKYKDSFGVYPDPSGNKSKSYTDILGDILDHYDVALDWWATSLERMSLGFSMTKGWYDSNTIMIIKSKTETKGVQFGAAFSPLKPRVWVLILLF